MHFTPAAVMGAFSLFTSNKPVPMPNDIRELCTKIDILHTQLLTATAPVATITSTATTTWSPATTPFHYQPTVEDLGSDFWETWSPWWIWGKATVKETVTVDKETTVIVTVSV